MAVGMEPISLATLSRGAGRGCRRIQRRARLRCGQSCGVKIKSEKRFQKFERKLEPRTLDIPHVSIWNQC
jgi:hypothetical protein